MEFSPSGSAAGTHPSEQLLIVQAAYPYKKDKKVDGRHGGVDKVLHSGVSIVEADLREWEPEKDEQPQSWCFKTRNMMFV